MLTPVFADPLEHIVAHSDPATRVYLGSPSLCLAPDGAIIASHDFFGPGSPKDSWGSEFLSRIHRSHDGGKTWVPVADLPAAFWSSLHSRGDAVYLLGCSAHDGDIVVRRSDDGGKTWTTPLGEDSGLLFRGGEGTAAPNYHCAPVPMLEHEGRLWRAFEDNAYGRWPRFHAAVISAGTRDDLLKSRSWRMTNKLAYDPTQDPPGFGPRDAGWLEGNVVSAPTGEIWNILRVNSHPVANRAAVTKVSADGAILSFDPRRGFVDFPGGMSKFSIRYDPAARVYWNVSNEVFNPRNPWQRNVLVLSSSSDLLKWTRRCVLLYAPQSERLRGKQCTIGFQYPDFVIDGEDMLFLVRTAFKGAHNFHDANYITFHRLERYAELLG